MHYAVFNGGKRFRPLLAYTVANVFNINDSNIIDPIACALECMHSYSLVHDDLPAMDDDDLRRGKASCHIAFDEATAILCGDALQCFAFELLCKTKLAAEKITHLIQLLCVAVGPHGMALGQHYDLLGRCDTAEELKSLHEFKTGKLITASVMMAYHASGDENNDTQLYLQKYANHLGIAFQICDDILDVTKSSDELGKPANSDIKNKKMTYVNFHGLGKARLLMQHEIEQAKNALAKINLRENYLAAIADFFIARGC